MIWKLIESDSMMNAKEAGRGCYPETTVIAESLEGKQNSFVVFIIGNQDLFEEYSDMTYELRDEENGWRNSPTVDSIVEQTIELSRQLYPNLNLDNKQIRMFGQKVKEFFFGNPDQEKEFTAKFLRQLGSAKFSLTPENTASINALGSNIKSFKTGFHNARSPLVSGILESRTGLFKKFEDFLLSSPSSLFAFQDFISDRKYGAEREKIRPFLASIAESEDRLAKQGKGALGETVKKWVRAISENATSDFIGEFVLSIESSNSDVFKWLKFSARISPMSSHAVQGIADYLKDRSDVSGWPEELKNASDSFVKSKYYSGQSGIRKELSQFKKPLTIKGPVGQDVFPQGKRKVSAGIMRKEPDNKQKEETEREIFPVGILTKEVGSPFKIKILTEEELANNLQKTADSFAPSDDRMKGDIEKMVLSLRKDPYGLGTEKLTPRTVSIEGNKIHLRSFNSRGRIGLIHDHEGSQNIRIVYVIYKNKGISVIGLQGIYTHDDYLSKFTA